MAHAAGSAAGTLGVRAASTPALYPAGLGCSPRVSQAYDRLALGFAVFFGFRPFLGAVAFRSSKRTPGRAPGTSSNSAGATWRIWARSNTVRSVGFC